MYYFPTPHSYVSIGDMSKKSWYEKHASWTSMSGALAVLFAPIAAAYAVLLRFPSRMPLLDDYHAILGFCVGWRELPTVADKLAFLASYQHVDYKLVLQELFFVSEMDLTHRIDIRLLIFIGNLFLLAILLVLWRIYSADNETLQFRLIQFLPVAFLFFSLNYAETLDFAISGLQILPVIFFSLASLYFLVQSFESNRKHSFPLACALALLASFTYANAFLVGPVGLLFLVAKRAYRRSLLWCATFLPGLGPYLWHYHRFPHPAGASIGTQLLFFITFLGAGNPSYKLVIPTGVVVLCSYLLVTRYRLYQANAAAYLCASWVMLTAVLVAIGRSGYGLDMSRASRYTIYSDLLLVFCYGFAFQFGRELRLPDSRKQQLYAAVLVFSAIFCVRADQQGYHFLSERRQKLEKGLEEYRAAPDRVSPMHLDHPELDVHHSQQEAREILTESIAAGIYKLPEPGQ